MENVKSLIILKPMSAPLQKLYEVLTSVATEENIEINLIENLSETTQLFSMGGQYLTLVSDPKQCALFLQENRSHHTSKHSKTLLFTNKPLPPKIMDKFIKLGLTDNVLDTAPPKTLLYKVKLLLKSLKPNDQKEKQSEKQDQVIRSMLDLNQTGATEKGVTLKEEVEAPITRLEQLKQKKIELELEGGLDYLKDLKKKKNFQEDNISTNWSSKQNSSKDIQLEESSSEDEKKQNQAAEIDGYMRNKQGTNTTLDLIIGEPKEKLSTSELTEETEKLEKVKKQFIELELENTKAKSHKLEIEEESTNSKVKSLKNTEIGLQSEIENDKSSNQLLDDENEITNKAKKSQVELELLAQEKSKKEKFLDEDGTSENMRGRLKTETNIELEDSELKEKEKKEYEKSEEKEKKRKTNIEIELEKDARDKKATATEEEINKELKQKNLNASDLDLTEEETKADALDEETEKEELKKKKARNIELELQSSKSNKDKNKLEASNESQDERNRVTSDQVTPLEMEDKKREKTDTNENAANDKQKKTLQLELTESTKKEKKEKEEDEVDENSNKKELSLQLISEVEEKEAKEKAQQSSEEKNRKTKSKAQIEIELESSKKKVEQSSEKIDGYMRSSDSKRPDQDWSQKNKSQDVTIKLVSNSQNEIEIQKKARRDNGEITIDYRMLRDEFNELAKSGYQNIKAEDNKNNAHLDEGEEANSFKVIELKANGFDFAVNLINQYYNPEIKTSAILKSVAQKLLNEEKAYCVFNVFVNKTNEHKETFNSFNDFTQESPVIAEHWNEFKKEVTNLDYIYSKSMATWQCRTIKEKDTFWTDNELPSWAAQELTNKAVEYIYPYYDGLDRMGMAYLYFPEGIQPQNEKKIMILLELLRGVFLETIQRDKKQEEIQKTETQEQSKGGVLSLLGGFFSKKKTG
jgi:hypothetical protein